MTGQPLVVWDRAEGCQVHDKWGNTWLDWSSGVLVTNAGHGRKEIVNAIVKQARKPLLHNYCFPSELRAKLAKRLIEISPAKLQKAFILTTGAETTECAIKLMRTHGLSVGGKKKIGIISFERAFHGRTLGSQQIGGSPALKEWIVNLDPCIWQVPFPDGFWTTDTSFDFFLAALKKQNITPDRVAGVILEDLPGRRRELRAEGVHAETRRLVREAQHRPDLRRSPGRLRPHGQALRPTSTTASCPTWSASARAFPARCRSAPSSAART